MRHFRKRLFLGDVEAYRNRAYLLHLLHTALGIQTRVQLNLVNLAWSERETEAIVRDIASALTGREIEFMPEPESYSDMPGPRIPVKFRPTFAPALGLNKLRNKQHLRQQQKEFDLASTRLLLDELGMQPPTAMNYNYESSDDES